MAAPQRQLREEATAALTEEIGVFGLDALASKQGVDAILERRAHSRQHDSVAKQFPQVAQLARSDVRLRQQIGAEQVRERARVDRVRLHSRCGDRFRPNGCAVQLVPLSSSRSASHSQP